jgi:chaperone required for assembly of F1-ATPase
MKRFYAAAAATADNGIRLDSRALSTPGRVPLIVPTPALAEAIAGEWNAQGEKIDPRAMPLTGLAYAAIDRIAPDPQGFARGLAAYGESDLLYYRAAGPPRLVVRQTEMWDPILAWARRRYDVDFIVTRGVIHRAQPEATLAQLGQAVAARDPFALAGLHPLVTIAGSLVVALALAEGALSLDEAWAAATVDEAWQAGQWGEDAEAAKALASRRAEFEAAARFLSLLQIPPA